MTEENVQSILTRLDQIQAKNDADHLRVERRLISIETRLTTVDDDVKYVRNLIDADAIERQLRTDNTVNS